MEINEILISEEARRSFLIGLVFLSKADGNVDESEKYFFQNAASSLALSDESTLDLNACWEKKEMPDLSFPDRTSKIFFLREAIQLSYVSGGFSEKERIFIQETAIHLGVSPSILTAIEEWVIAGMVWKNNGDDLLEMEG